MTSPNFYNYGRYSSDNYGVHTLCFCDTYGNEFWYSYSTLVAFCIKGEFHIHKNIWGTTTGKHLNWINTSAKREDTDTFNANLNRLSALIAA